MPWAICERLVHRDGHAGLGHGDAELIHDRAEAVAILGEVDRLGARAQDAHAGGLELAGQVEGRLAAELGDDTQGLLLLVDGQHVLGRERLKVELVARVVVGRDGLGVAVHDDGLEAELFERLGRVDTAVVELDALADAVGASAQDHNLAAVAHRALVLGVVGGVIIGAISRGAHMHALPRLGHAGGDAGRAHLGLGQVQNLSG